jgi:hypothetical protein
LFGVFEDNFTIIGDLPIVVFVRELVVANVELSTVLVVV